MGLIMKKAIILLIAALFCSVPQAKAQPVAEDILKTVVVVSGFVFVGTGIATLFDGLDSKIPEGTLDGVLVGSGALTFVSLVALNMYTTGQVPF
jgi:hypothetical protein